MSWADPERGRPSASGGLKPRPNVRAGQQSTRAGKQTRFSRASAMWASGPTAWPAHPSAHLVQADLDTPFSGFFLLGRCNPAYPLISRDRGYSGPETPGCAIGFDGLPKVGWELMGRAARDRFGSHASIVPRLAVARHHAGLAFARYWFPAVRTLDPRHRDAMPPRSIYVLAPEPTSQFMAALAIRHQPACRRGDPGDISHAEGHARVAAVACGKVKR